MKPDIHTKITLHLIDSYLPRYTTSLIIQYRAQGWTPSQIVKKLHKLNINCPRTSVVSTCKRYRTYIKQLQEQE